MNRRTIVVENDELADALEALREDFERARLLNVDKPITERRGDTLALMMEASGWTTSPATSEARERRELATRIMNEHSARRAFTRRIRERADRDAPFVTLHVSPDTHDRFEDFREAVASYQDGLERAPDRPPRPARRGKGS